MNPNAKDFLKNIQKSKDAADVSLGVLDGVLEGRKNILDLNIAVGLDVSGSISREDFRLFMLQLDAIKGLSRVKVIEVDTEIVAMYDYYKTHQNRVARLGGGGGTCFTQAFEKFKQMKPDAILFMTDGDAAGVCHNPGIPTGWILTEKGCKPPYAFGEVVAYLRK
jgi:predicted metal-dependent peptidase